MGLSYSNKFFLKPVAGTKRARIYQRLIVNREKAELYTGLEIEEKIWDAASQRTKGNAVINTRLVEKESELHKLIGKLQEEDRDINAKLVKSLLRGDEEDQKKKVKLLAYAEKYIAGREEDGELTARTIWGFKNLKDHLTKFITLHVGEEDVALKDIDYNFLKSLDSYLLKQKAEGKNTTLKRNTINKHHVRLRTFLHAAVREGVLEKNPYSSFKLKDTPAQRKYLTEEELRKLVEHDLNNNVSLQRIRDIFVWSVYTGLRYQDAMDAEAKQVQKDSEGNYYIQLYQNKTGESVNIPLLQPAVDIFNRYDNDERKVNGKILPRISNAKVNEYLKSIGILAGIETPITHHVARHTCATTVLLANDIPMEVVSKWLGHSDFKTTQIYGKITNPALMRAGKVMREKLRIGSLGNK
ncbi:site-specific integrase [Cesiribacter sp. SM1]|uniref:site-specific integrase n=1 Tax=Cesiribacter sp. SM1 TaxID=2861196 RepID=UPI001CD51438|nr:site-specific integrase [Cesiribacter sp. SM1]